MKLFRCLACFSGFAIFLRQPGKGDKGKPDTTAKCCPRCKSDNIEEVDTVKEVAGHLLKRALKFWNDLPSGE